MSILAAGTNVKINQGFGVFAFGKIVSYNPGANKLGNKGNYLIELTGGKNALNKPVVKGELHTVLAVHVSAMHLSIVA